jgi:hypothetical protein
MSEMISVSLIGGEPYALCPRVPLAVSPIKLGFNSSEQIQLRVVELVSIQEEEKLCSNFEIKFWYKMGVGGLLVSPIEKIFGITVKYSG